MLRTTTVMTSIITASSALPMVPNATANDDDDPDDYDDERK